MAKNTNRPQTLTIVLAVLLVAALAVGGWLIASNNALQRQVDALQADGIAAGEALAEAQAQLTAAQDELSRTQAELAQTRESLSAAQAELADMTAARDAAQAQVGELTAALDASNAELAKVTADKEAADAALAALGYAPIQTPMVVEPVVEAPAADETPAPAAEEPAEEEGISETPAEAYESPAVTVFTADALGIAFEAPVDWVILLDNAEECYILHSPEDENGQRTTLTITAVPAQGDDPLAALMDAAEGEPAPAQLLGQEGLCIEYDLPAQEGQPIRERLQAAVADGVLYTVCISTPAESFGAEADIVFRIVCESLRLIY